MDDARCMSGGERRRDLDRHLDQFAKRQRAVVQQPPPQRVAIDQLRCDEVDRAVAADLVDRDDVGMVER